MFQADAAGANQLSGKTYKGTLTITKLEIHGERCNMKFEALLQSMPCDIQLPELVEEFFNHELESGLPCSVALTFHEALAIACDPHGTERHASETVIARVAPQFHSLPYFSNVAIQGEAAGDESEDGYGQAVCYISFKSYGEDCVTKEHKLVLVRFYEEVAEERHGIPSSP